MFVKTTLVFLSIMIQTSLMAQIIDTPVPEVSAGRIERLADLSFLEIVPRTVDVWLPPGYSPKTPCPVLYMNDGQMLFDPNITWNQQEWGVDEVMDSLLNNQTIPPCIVVAIPNAGPGRHFEYFPQKVLENLRADLTDEKVTIKKNIKRELLRADMHSDAYLRFIVHELKPFVDAHFATLPGPETTFIAGSSMGGLISMYALCEYPDVFGGAACLSTHWPGMEPYPENPIPVYFQRYLSDHLPVSGHHKIYFDYGTETLDASYEPYQLAVDSIFRQKGYGPKQYRSLKFQGQDHSENAWRKRLNIPLEFLLTR